MKKILATLIIAICAIVRTYAQDYPMMPVWQYQEEYSYETNNNPIRFYINAKGGMSEYDGMRWIPVTVDAGAYANTNQWYGDGDVGVLKVPRNFFVMDNSTLVFTYQMPLERIDYIPSQFYYYGSTKTIVEAYIYDNIKNIAAGVFCEKGIKKLHVDATTPATCEVGAFANIFDNCKLYVPKGFVSTYKAADVWKNFSNIVDQYSLALSENNALFGAVTGSGNFDYDSSASISAVAKANCQFVKWSDGNTNATRDITLDKDSAIRAIFKANATDVLLDTTTNSLIIHWLAPSAATKYVLSVFSDSTKTTLLQSIILDKNLNLFKSASLDCSYEVTGLNSGSSYYYTLLAVDASDVLQTYNEGSFRTASISTSDDLVQTKADIVFTKYYDLSGNSINAPLYNSAYVKVILFKNGETKSEKVFGIKNK